MHSRWMVALLLALATALNYLDRQNLPVAIVAIQRDIAISDRAYSVLQMLFLGAYGVMYAGGGFIVDRLGTRAGYALMIAWWSVANGLHGAANSLWTLGLCRIGLGLGEGGGFPASAKAVAEWFPRAERSFAFGIFNTGSSVGAVIAPPLVAYLATAFHWRWVFVLTGLAGLVWAAIWLWFYTPGPETAESRTSVRWASLFGYREVRVLVSAKLVTDAAWFFFVFWLPKYLAEARGLDLKQIGAFAWIPYAAAGVGSFAGGWLGAALIRRGWSVSGSRHLTLGLSAACLPAALGVAAAPLPFAIVFMSLAFLGHQFWSTIIQTLPTDLFPSTHVGSVAGLLGAAGSFGGMLFSWVVGEWLSAGHGYGQLFLIAGLMHPLSFVLIRATIPQVKPVRIEVR